MTFQTIFYLKATGQIIAITPNKYIRSKFEKARFCPGYTADEINFLYFPSTWPILQDVHRVQFVSAGHPPYVVDELGLPMINTDRRMKFIELAARYMDIVVDLADSMGDQLLRVACVIEAQKQYPNHRFFCKCEPQYLDVLSLCPEITLFKGFPAHGLDPKQCGQIIMNGGHLYDPRGNGFNKACVYGAWLNLGFVPYHPKLVIPPEFEKQFVEFDKKIDLRADGHNVVFQLRSKNWEGKCWDVEAAVELARLIKEVYTCNIYWLGTDIDVTGEHQNIINLAGKTNWIETVRILTRSAHVFCIDSSVQHLCRALDIPYICLWGDTHPQHIMGEDPRPDDIIDTFTCGPSNIKAITPIRVFNVAFPENKKPVPIVYDPAKDTSQHGEQKIIFKHFQGHPPKRRALVDVGAFGKMMSNTFALLELGWKGLLIEANPERAAVVETEFSGLDVKILNIGISDAPGTMPLHLHSELGHDSLISDWYPQDATGNSLDIQVFPLATILKREKVPFDFDLLSIDTEGLDEKIMAKLLASSKYRPRLIVTECTSYLDALSLYNSYGYEFVEETGGKEYGNLIFKLRD